MGRLIPGGHGTRYGKNGGINWNGWTGTKKKPKGNEKVDLDDPAYHEEKRVLSEMDAREKYFRDRGLDPDDYDDYY